MGFRCFLPGINVLVGLEGERKETLDINLRFLQGIVDEGLMLRRINIRQVIPVRREFPQTVSHSVFLKFKEKVRNDIDRPLLERLVPVGTVLRKVYTEMREGKVTFGRQIGTYPLLVGIDHPVDLDRFVNVAVVGHGFRSFSGVVYPLNVNTCHITALETLPGLDGNAPPDCSWPGPSRARRVCARRWTIRRSPMACCRSSRSIEPSS